MVETLKLENARLQSVVDTLRLLGIGFQVDSVSAGGLSVRKNAAVVLAGEMRTVVLRELSGYVRSLRLPYLYFFLGVGGGGMLN